MPRPMTAKDRTPEVGDVLEYLPMGLLFTIGRQEVAQRGAILLTRYLEGSIQAELVPFDERMQYVRRADDGPVEVGEG